MSKWLVLLLFFARTLAADELSVIQRNFVGPGRSSGKAAFIKVGDKDVLFPLPGNPTTMYHDTKNRIFAVNFDALSNYRSFGVAIAIGKAILIYADVGRFAVPELAIKKLIPDANYKSQDLRVEAVDGNRLMCHLRGFRAGAEQPEESKFSLIIEADETRLSMSILPER